MNETLKLILTIVQVVLCIVMIGAILMQTGKSDGLGNALSGTAETFFGKNKGRDLESKLARATAYMAGAFVVLTFVLAIF
ncbi:MAG: preprotein translocase subunit SecG [Clostridiaceae bacterium]|nr:preprotein translocase subunit SecG [Clostridiaceae bacterium]